jgi:kumamolisin
MAEQPKLVEVAGSNRSAPLRGAVPVGEVHSLERFEVTIRVRRQTALVEIAPAALAATVRPAQRDYLSREEYAASHGSSQADLDAVAHYATAQGLTVLSVSKARRSVFVSGTAPDYAKAFGAQVAVYEHDGGTYRGRTGSLTVPVGLAPLIEGIFGIDDRPVAQPHFRVRAAPDSPGVVAHAAAASFLPTQIAKFYDFPADATGAGQTIGIIELGGGYKKADITAYFKQLGIKAPEVTPVLVDHARNHPTTASSADGEVMLDILVAGAVAPGAKIAVYFAPNTDAGFLDALTLAIHDETNKPSVISISWGGPESSWTAQAMNSFDEALQTAAALGVTVTAAAGDNGSTDGVTDGKAHVDFPASSPHILATGGTFIAVAGDKIVSESVWNESSGGAGGGGISDFFALPAYQASTGVPQSANPGGHVGRGVPDVAGDADPQSGYEVRVDGQNLVIGGTSAVAPLWAGLIALFNEKLGHPVGFLNPLIYAAPVKSSGAFNDILVGNNGAYAAATGWDACTGWGSPVGTKLFQVL